MFPQKWTDRLGENRTKRQKCFPQAQSDRHHIQHKKVADSELAKTELPVKGHRITDSFIKFTQQREKNTVRMACDSLGLFVRKDRIIVF